MFIVGITGGIGSGKSAVTERFERLGITVVDADLASRVIMQPGKPALQAIALHFGEELILDDGNLDRAALRKCVFADTEQRLWLEQLTHPLIGEEIRSQLQASSSHYTILSSPLLLETSQANLADCIVVVDVPVEVQIQRTMSRDNNNETLVKQIIAAQMSREQRLEKADIVIDNSQTLADLDQCVQRLHQQFLTTASDGKSH